MANWQNGKLTKWQVDKMVSWQNGKLTKFKVDKMASWWNDKFMKWKVNKILSWEIDKLKNWQVFKLASIQSGKLAKWHVDNMTWHHFSVKTSPYAFWFNYTCDDINYRLLKQLLGYCKKTLKPGNTKWGNTTVQLTSCLTGLESSVWKLTSFAFICKTD